MSSTPPPTPRSTSVPLVAAGVLTAALIWVFWPTLVEMAERWESDPQYSHGFLVPLFSAYLLWSRRGRLAGADLGPSWWGVPVLLVGLAARAVGIAIYFDWLAAAALVPCLAGVALLAAGRPALRWAWPAAAFLVFMVPLPFRIEIALAHPLQRIATIVSTYALETLGFVAVSEGNTIRMGNVRLGVVEACSGLSMLMIFFALATALAVVVRRPWYEKALLVASAIPVALVANITRITVTGILHKTAGSEIADLVFHDLAGWLMMPFALGLLWVEMKVFGWVVVDAPAQAADPALSLPTAPAAVAVPAAVPAGGPAGAFRLPLPAQKPAPTGTPPGPGQA